MRIVLVDEDGLLRDSVEALIPKTGHELVGLADTTAAGVRLIETARPDAVVFDMSLGYNTDFDVIQTAGAVGAKVVVFSYTADAGVLSRYPVRPTVVPKPELGALETVLHRLSLDDEAGVVEADRRARPSRQLTGPAPTSVGDVAAFYEAINEAQPGDAMVSLLLHDDVTPVAARVAELLRHGDRLLATSSSLRIFLVSGGDEGVTSFLIRLGRLGVVPAATEVRSIVVRGDEQPIDAFERLKSDGELRAIPT